MASHHATDGSNRLLQSETRHEADFLKSYRLSSLYERIMNAIFTVSFLLIAVAALGIHSGEFIKSDFHFMWLTKLLTMHCTSCASSQ